MHEYLYSVYIESKRECITETNIIYFQHAAKLLLLEADSCRLRHTRTRTPTTRTVPPSSAPQWDSA